MFAADLMSMIRDGAGLVIATVAPDGEPRAGRAWSAAAVDADARRLRIAVGGDDPVTVANLETGRITLTGADVATFHSVQLKGRIVLVEAPAAADLALVEEQAERFFDKVHLTDGNPIEHLRRLLPIDVLMVELEVDEMYDQTPGPDAGAPLVAR